MQTSPDMLDFLKAATDVDRLRIIGLLTKQPATRADVVEKLNIPLREAFQHLSFLEYVGVVKLNGELYELDSERLSALAREQLLNKREQYVPAPELDAFSQKVLKTHLRSDGSIRQIPIQQPEKLRVILNYLIQAFEPNVDYKEKEVNQILRRFNEDTAGLRRDLVDANLLARESDGSRYWRVTA